MNECRPSSAVVLQPREFSGADPLPAGRFAVGCNYWASHAGPWMWEQWDADVVAADFDALKNAGLDFLRVFPLWSSFQPIVLLCQARGRPREIAWGESPLPPEHPDGVLPEMLDRLHRLAELAHERGIRLVVAPVTGWMSGRLFVPPALDGLELYSNPTARLWAQRYLRAVVTRLRDCPAVVAWEPGNETNCLSYIKHHDEFHAWFAEIVAGIRAADPTRPVYAGLHSAQVSASDPVSIPVLGEWADALTTHPYPLFTPYCDLDPMDSFRPSFHAVAESRLYADLSGRPCHVQEIGTLGDSICTGTVAAAYINTVLWNCWAQDLRALQWWCAFDEDHIDRAPFSWNANERALGLYAAGRRPKPTLEAMAAFRRQLDALPLPDGKLPPCRREAVCIVGSGCEAWAAAYASFLLAKQAGFDLNFVAADRPLPEARLYLMPSVGDGFDMPGVNWRALLGRVRAGATLSVSSHGGNYYPFEEPFGARMLSRTRAGGALSVRFDAADGGFEWTVAPDHRLRLALDGATAAAGFADGTPAAIDNRYGKGRIRFTAFPAEMLLARTPGAFHADDAPPYWRVYQRLAVESGALAGRALRNLTPPCSVTEHPVDDNDSRRVVVIVNASSADVERDFALAAGWTVESAWRGAVPAAGRLRIPANDAAVWLLGRG